MRKRIITVILLLFPLLSFSQEKAFTAFLADSSMAYASVSFYITYPDSSSPVFSYNSGKSLNPASEMKLITSSASIEMLGPDYRFMTTVGYTGTLNKRSGRLNGNIIIKGGGDPALGSKNFEEHYSGFAESWIEEIRKQGIKKVSGRVITDDSYYDYLPVPAKWLWEDAGNYYGAGAYGLSVFDNTYEIHLKRSPDSLSQIITGIYPKEYSFRFSNWLGTEGTRDNANIFAAPYSTNGWLAGTVLTKQDTFVLKASIADPPLIMAKVIDQMLRDSGIDISGQPTTTRLLQSTDNEQVIPVTETISPPLKDIIEVMNHESINLYAEHLLKELGKVFGNSGSTETGVKVVKQFLSEAGINTDGIFIEDGSGLSPLNAVNSIDLVTLLSYMKKKGKYFNEFLNSLPESGKEGTLKNYFRDPLFDTRLSAKSGSMTRVRNYAGYITSLSGNELIFCVLVNNYTGPVQNIISHIEEILREIIKNK
ncbi:MAG: D-alanyl-D-alanine carboxypeptidase/D-alanyl-D-alanine-endopeptidase [Bacteroidales bacterium]|jgi:D-alanyl-D-alanine carboxypeptidase/D-alanyl-D-alanine-endopeptidase (penicillin-binding protein 4)|nr:D-alanyl-D-alanine carboxypeptidase/D-alanyl-D-alanine-endopeptidase [Bacteroidales bacterium]